MLVVHTQSNQPFAKAVGDYAHSKSQVQSGAHPPLETTTWVLIREEANENQILQSEIAYFIMPVCSHSTLGVKNSLQEVPGRLLINLNPSSHPLTEYSEIIPLLCGPPL